MRGWLPRGAWGAAGALLPSEALALPGFVQLGASVPLGRAAPGLVRSETCSGSKPSV